MKFAGGEPHRQRAIQIVMSPIGWWALVAVATLLRNGIEVQGTVLRQLESRSAADEAIPTPSIGYALTRVSDAFGIQLYLISWATLVFALTVGIALNLCRFTSPERRLIGLLILLGPWTSVILKDLATTDAFTYLGAILAVTASRTPVMLLGAALFATSHPEAAVISGLVILGYNITSRAGPPNLSHLAPVAWVGILVGVPLSLWSASLGGPRTSLFLEYLPGSVTLFLASAPLAIYAWLGAIWGALLFIAWRRVWSGTWRVVLGIVVLASISVVTADGTRVAAAMLVTFVSGLFIAYTSANTVTHVDARRALLLLLLPALVISNGIVNLPYDEVLIQLGLELPRP